MREAGEGMGDFRKKNSCRLISREKNSCKEIPGEKDSYTENEYLLWRTRLQKILTPLYVRKKNYITRGLGKIELLPKLTHPYPAIPQKSNGRPLS